MNSLIAKVTGCVQENTQEEWEVDAAFLDQAIRQMQQAFMERLQSEGVSAQEAETRWNQAKKTLEQRFRTFSADKIPQYGNRLGVWRRPDASRASYKWMPKE
jgi:hypothetical protein